MTDMQFGLTLTVFGGGLTLVSLYLIVIVMKIMMKVQKSEGEKQSQAN